MANTIPNPFEYSKDPELNTMFDKMVSLKARVEDQFKKANSIAGLDAEAKFLPLEQVKISLPTLDSLRNPSNGRWGSSVVSLERVLEQATNAINVARAEVERVEKANAANLENNNNLSKQIKSLMTRLGFSESYSTFEYPSSRSRNKKEVRHTAGYVADIERMRPKSNTYMASTQIKDYEARLSTYIQSERAKEIKEKTDSDTKAVEHLLNATPELMEFLVLCNVNIMTRMAEAPVGCKKYVIKEVLYEILEDTLTKDKYLNLAYMLECNRNDWNDGPDFAERGLNGFNIETKQDQEIYDEISHHISDWDGDGRVFRDCDWNYSRIYEMVKDVNLINKVRRASGYLESL